MPDWLAPFHLPKFTDAEFEKQKDKYNKEKGYVITMPAWDDIIKLKQFPPLTEQEAEAWKKKRYNEIPPLRLEEIRAEKKKKQEKYLAQLASPSPKLARSAGAVLTALDDVQDALSTLACIGMIAAVVVGGTTAAVLSGPVGWIAGTATLLSMINPYSWMKGGKGAKGPLAKHWIRGKDGKFIVGRAGKKDAEKSSDKNPFSKKARAKVARRMKKFRPGVANAIEALQVTAGIFGVGLSLGPILGFAQDVVSGIVRELAGQKVTFATSPPKIEPHAALAQKALKAQAVLHGVPWKSDLTDEIMSLFAANLALQVVEPYLQEWNPFDQVENLASAMIQAPRPTNILTLEIIEESGRTLDQVCNWPQNGEQWISLGELQELTAPQATANLTHFAEANPNSVEAFIAGQNAHDFALNMIEAIEGTGQVYIEYSHIERIVIIILDNGWVYPDDITEAQVEKFEDWCYVHEYMDTQPNAIDIWRYAQVFCNFTWAKSPDEYR